MSKKEDDQEMSMEEILASIRRYVSGDPVDAPPDNLKGRNKDVYSNYQQARSSDSNQRYANQPSFEPSERVSQANYVTIVLPSDSLYSGCSFVDLVFVFSQAADDVGIAYEKLREVKLQQVNLTCKLMYKSIFIQTNHAFIPTVATRAVK